jgi:glycosyltransferase involved in cell wall biosynthesis
MHLEARVTGEPPRVAIVTPSYRMARFIGETVDSVLSQDYPHVDYLVVDGGSDDGTVELLEGRGVRYVSEPDDGQADAVNKGFALTEGELFTFLNADDTLLPGGLGKAVEALRLDPGAAVVYGQADYVDEEGSTVAPYPTAPFDRDLLAHECFICQPAALMRREAFAEVGMLDTSLDCAIDYDLWIRLSERARFAYLEERLATSRMHADNKSLGRRDELYRESIELAKRHFGYVPMAWLAPYAAFRTTGADQFTEQSEASPRSRALALALGVRRNPRQLGRFLADWQADGFAGRFPDGWISKAYLTEHEVPEGATRLLVRGRHQAPVRRPLVLRVQVDGKTVGRRAVRHRGPFELELPWPADARGRRARVEVRSAWTWRPHLDGDVRRLSCLVDEVDVL